MEKKPKEEPPMIWVGEDEEPTPAKKGKCTGCCKTNVYIVFGGRKLKWCADCLKRAEKAWSAANKGQ